LRGGYSCSEAERVSASEVLSIMYCGGRSWASAVRRCYDHDGRDVPLWFPVGILLSDDPRLCSSRGWPNICRPTNCNLK